MRECVPPMWCQFECSSTRSTGYRNRWLSSGISGLIDDESDTEALIEAIKKMGSHTGAGSVADYLFGEGESVKLYVTWTDEVGNSYEPLVMEIPYQVPATE